jgi:uncharacterized membrane protein YkoI
MSRVNHSAASCLLAALLACVTANADAGASFTLAWHEQRDELRHAPGHDHAPPPRWRDDSARRDYQPRAPGLSLDEAVERAERQSGGRVLSAQTVYDGSRPVYRIKLLTPSGRVRVMVMDAQ